MPITYKRLRNPLPESFGQKFPESFDQNIFDKNNKVNTLIKFNPITKQVERDSWIKRAKLAFVSIFSTKQKINMIHTSINEACHEAAKHYVKSNLKKTSKKTLPETFIALKGQGETMPNQFLLKWRIKKSILINLNPQILDDDKIMKHTRYYLSASKVPLQKTGKKDIENYYDKGKLKME